MILYNSAGGRIPPEAGGSPIPVVSIAQEDGELINSRLDKGPVTPEVGRRRRGAEPDGRAAVRRSPRSASPPISR